MQPISDFWRGYPAIYQGLLKENEAKGEYVFHLGIGDYRMHQGNLVQMAGLPLHPNARLLYETILNLHPRTVLEIGCGSGDNLHNLLTLDPALSVYGLDLMHEQIDFARTRSPELAEKLWQADIAEPQTIHWQYDLVYSHAVVMHLEDRVGQGIENMMKLARRHVVMIENWGSNEAMNLLLLKMTGGWSLRTVTDGLAHAVIVEAS